MASFQQVIGGLSQFWTERGCVLLPPIDVEVGTGTMVPEVFLRLFGPEPWRGAHVQASRRPWDGRYGSNNLRLGKHYQFQVLLKPPSDDARSLFFGSLQAVGLDLAVHDVQFRDERWSVLTLGVEGMGWGICVDGIKLAHMSYLQEAGGRPLEPVSLELTYGLERLVMLQQGSDQLLEAQWDEGVSYGEVRQLEEEDFSHYYFEVADVGLLRHQFEACSEEAARCLENNLVLPAYELVLKCSHLFQILLFRGGLGKLDEVELRSQMRRLADECASRYLKRREGLGFPLLGAFGTAPKATEEEHAEG